MLMFCSGLNFDRFVDQFDEPTLNRVRQQYWTAKQLIRKTLGKKEDEYLLASDAEFDAKLTHFRCIQQTSERMLCCIDDYQHYLGELGEREFELSKVLKMEGEAEVTIVGRAMIAVSRALTVSAHHRLQIRSPLLKFFRELHVFSERAVSDCADTVNAAEKSRTEYRGSLLWMKRTSKELDPDAENALEKFRTAQAVVRRNKKRLDGLKLDTLQKVNLLAASRCHLFSQMLESYQKLIHNYFEQTALTFKKIYYSLSDHKQNNEFQILTDLNEPLIVTDDNDEKEIKNSKSESLIELDEREQELEQVIHDLESFNALGLLDSRLDSPLGLPEEAQNANDYDKSETTAEILLPIEASVPRKLPVANVPAIAPPPGWKPNSSQHLPNVVKLLSLNDETSENNCSSDLSRLMSSSSSSCDAATSKATITSQTLTMPSQLLDFPFDKNGFPNPFSESNNSNFDVSLNIAKLRLSSFLM
ncbi:unnamed protein product [Thelazia callipaeda]|uniref:AH domain-containing protein n=1 Tax=Thelazia callipaeda TaxID=103827 RepID=A0A0N5CQL5_THECL|nr:unnamed protein product [Thelazia callipaeda]